MRIRVWDLPTRVLHWVLATLVVFSFTTGKIGGEWLDWHMKSGYTILTLLLFRVTWGLAGSETSRFSQFVRGPSAFLRYAGDIAGKRHTAVVGHNPMGGWMVLLLLAVLFAQTASGLFADDEISHTGPLVEKVSNAVVSKMSAFHEFNGWIIVAAAVVHVLAIAFYWFRLKDDLVRPMWNGWREVDAGTVQPAMRASWLAAILLAVAAGAVYWLVAVYPKA